MSHERKAFFSVLFDFSFGEFITERVIAVLYALSILSIAGGAGYFIFIAFKISPLAGLSSLVIAPILALIYVIMARVGLEIVIVLFKIADNTSDTEKILERRAP